MTDNEYLNAVLDEQKLADDSDEMQELRDHRDAVEALLRKEYGAYTPTIKYGGSKAKGTLIKESYDLDLVCYFPSEETGPGDTLEDIFNNVSNTLAADYYVERKTSAVRLKKKDAMWEDFHIDVVPGRFTDDTRTDCYLYQHGVEKCRLKTNLKVHIDHIRDAGVTPALRLLKLWRSRRAIGLKNFAWELLCVKLLTGKKSAALEDQVEHVLRTVAEATEVIKIEDPANPQGNDLMTFLNQHWGALQAAAVAAIAQLEFGGWEAVFGKLQTEEAKSEDVARLTRAAAAVHSPSQPWLK